MAVQRRKLPHRYATQDDFARSHPIHAVWEITLACNLNEPCGSRAARRVPGSCDGGVLEVVRQPPPGVREVTSSRRGLHATRLAQIIRAIATRNAPQHRARRALNEERIRAAKEAGLPLVRHLDRRDPGCTTAARSQGSYEHAIRALHLLKQYEIVSSVNTQIGATTLPHLRGLLHRIAEAGVRNWQIQLTVAMGNAADNPDVLMQPYQMLELMPHLAELFDEANELGVLIQPGNNIGYFGPYEHRWRATDLEYGHWQGCAAGHTGLGIEADGTIKGCPSLATADYSGGNVRDMTIVTTSGNHSDQLALHARTHLDDLWVSAVPCYYARRLAARAAPGPTTPARPRRQQPYCHHRRPRAGQGGKRERIVNVEERPRKTVRSRPLRAHSGVRGRQRRRVGRSLRRSAR